MKKRKTDLKKIINLGVILIIGIFVFGGLLTIENKIMYPKGKVEAFILKKDMDKGTVITESNISDYFRKDLIDGRLEVSNGVTDGRKDLLNHISKENLNAGTVVAKNYFVNKDNILNKIKNPVEVSFSTSDVSDVLGGTLREGDVVTLSKVDKDNSEQIIKNAYVKRVFSNDNKKVEKDSDIATMTINVMIPESDLNSFNDAVENSKIRVSMNK